MSAPGIQLSPEPHLTYFQPTIRQYLQSIKDAVASNNLPAAQQAFAQLAKAVPAPARGSSATNEIAARISQSMQTLGQALETSDLAAAQQAIAGLHRNIQSMSDHQGGEQASVTVEPGAGSEVSSIDGGILDAGSGLNVRA